LQSFKKACATVLQLDGERNGLVSSKNTNNMSHVWQSDTAFRYICEPKTAVECWCSALTVKNVQAHTRQKKCLTVY